MENGKIFKNQMVNKVVLAIKTILRQKNMTYGDLGKSLGVSVPTVKRVLSTGDMPFRRLLDICAVLELNPDELFEAAGRASNSGSLYMAPTQEGFLCQNTKHFLVWMELWLGRSLEHLAEDLLLGRNALEKILGELVEQGLILRDASLERTRIPARMAWRRGGALANRIRDNLFEQLQITEPAQKAAMFLKLTPETRKNLEKDLNEILDRYERISTLESRLGGPLEAVWCCGAIGVCEPWDTPLHRKAS